MTLSQKQTAWQKGNITETCPGSWQRSSESCITMQIEVTAFGHLGVLALGERLNKHTHAWRWNQLCSRQGKGVGDSTRFSLKKFNEYLIDRFCSRKWASLWVIGASVITARHRITWQAQTPHSNKLTTTTLHLLYKHWQVNISSHKCI